MVKTSPQEMMNRVGEQLQIVIDRDYRAAVVASALKAAHLTLFHMLGYRYVFSPTGLYLADILKQFYLAPDDDLLGYGVPADWLNDVRAATEDSIFALADHLPGEAAEALLELATGGKPRIPQAAAATTDPFDHPDAQRRFRVMANAEELQVALEYPWEKWTVFLHPDQRDWVARDYNGPARVSGSAGTGKTIVAIHRTAHLARTNPDARVLLTTSPPRPENPAPGAATGDPVVDLRARPRRFEI